MIRFLLFISLWFAADSVAQTKSNSLKAVYPQGAVVNFSDGAIDFEPLLQNMEMPRPGSPGTKGEILLLKQQLAGKYPRRDGVAVADKKSAQVAMPAITNSFEGNLAGNSVPNDNDIAVSNDGKVLSVINSIAYVYDLEKDSLLLKKNLSTIAAPLQYLSSKFDPKALYDPLADRFILMFLNGSTYQTSRVIVCFSQTNDPSGLWNLYALPGNPLANDTWSDYPVVGLSNTDLYIGINTFTNGSSNNSGFTESTFWQIGLEEGYGGDSLQTRYYHDILQNMKPIFNITPVSGGIQMYGPNMYLLSSRNIAAENDTIFLLEVSNSVKHPDTELKVKIVKSPFKYILPPNARQKGNHYFDSNDCRVLGAFYDGSQIQFVLSTRDTLSGKAAVYHGKLRMKGMSSISASVIVHPSADIAYPNIASTGKAPLEREAIITFNHSDTASFSGFSGIYYSRDGEYSDIITIKTGDNYVDVLQDTIERWGDYSGIQTKYNEPGKVFAAGSFGKANKRHGTWIAGIVSPDSLRPVIVKTGPENILYPNPAEDVVAVNFNLDNAEDIYIDIVDASGRFVARLLNDRAKQGYNSFTFSTQPLSAGIYFIRIYTGDKVIFKNRFVRKS